MEWDSAAKLELDVEAQVMGHIVCTDWIYHLETEISKCHLHTHPYDWQQFTGIKGVNEQL